MKKIISFLSVFAIVMFSGCTYLKPIESTPVDINELTDFYLSCYGALDENIVINNKISKEEALVQEYSLDELAEYFDQIYSRPFVFSGSEPFIPSRLDNNERIREENDFCMSVMNDNFPIRFIRFDNERCYAIYRVEEGGWFYIFFNCILSDYELVDGILKYKEGAYGVVTSTYAAYLPGDFSLSHKDFSSISPGKSTLKDVYEIDENIRINAAENWENTISNTIEGTVWITYEHNHEFTVKSINFYDHSEEHVPFSYLASVLPQDLPN